MEDVINKKFNKLTVLKRLQGSKVQCLCECGNEKICSLKDLKRNRIIGCGCARNTPELRELARIRAYNLQEKGILNKGGNYLSDRYTFYKVFLKRMKNRKKGIKKCDISLEDLEEVWHRQNGLCAYTKIPLTLVSHSNLRKDIAVWNLASVDRIDSDRGYEKDNIHFVSRTINYAKNNMSHNEMLQFLSFLKQNLQ
jgi:hypothetical protein